MRSYAFNLTFLSPTTNLPNAPSLFGHLAWWVRYTQGEGGLEGFLRDFREGPPFILSSAFPEGFLPKPLVAPVGDERLKDSGFRKLAKRLRYLSFSAFEQVIEGGEHAFLDLVEKGLVESEGAAFEPRLHTVSRTRVGINRQTGTAQEGILFNEALKQPSGSWTIYVRLLDDRYTADWIGAGLRAIGAYGYGGRASVGLGRFGVAAPQLVDLPEAQGANAYTTLAPCLAPHADGHYSLETYWGRLGGHYAHSDNPFKRPYLRAREGSTFRGQAPLSAQLLPVAAPEEGVTVYDYLYPFPLGVRLEER